MTTRLKTWASAAVLLAGCGAPAAPIAPAEPFTLTPPSPPAPVTVAIAKAPAPPAERASEPAKPRRRPTGPVDVPADGQYGAKHILVMHVDSKRKPTHVQRTKPEARTRIEMVLEQLAQDPSDWDALCAQYSDEPGAKQRAGDLGHFHKGMMVPEFQEGVERTHVGTLSDVVETDFGFHIILRTK